MVQIEMGDPAPLGLLSFAVTTALLMYVDMEWAEANLKELVWGYAVWYGGGTQLIVGVLELVKGNTFGGVAFSTYGCFWLGWAWMWLESKEGDFRGSDYFRYGEVFWLTTFGVLTSGFWIITLRKNLCLVTVFGLLAITFYILALGVFHEDAKKVGGYVGFATALAAAYTAFATLLSQEFGTNVIPGLEPLRKKNKRIDAAVMEKRLSYDKKRNTLLVDFRELDVNTEEDIQVISTAVRTKVNDAGQKVDAVINYHDFKVASHLIDTYEKMVQALHADCYASVTRFHTDMFQERTSTAGAHLTSGQQDRAHHHFSTFSM